MITEVKTFELNNKTFIEYFKTQGRFKKVNILSDRACFIFWLNGKNKLFTEYNQVTSYGKDSLLLRCGAYINELLPQSEEGIELLVIHLYPEMLRTVFQHQFPETTSDLSSGSFPLKLSHHQLIEKYVEGLLLLFKHPEIVSDDFLILKLKELIFLVTSTQHRPNIERLLRHLFSQREISFQQVIESQLYSGLSVKELAYLTHRSAASFKRDFQKYYKTSPAVYIKNQKLKKARQLLKSTQLRITEIVFECGFKNISHFTRLFHEKYQVAPSAFRLSQTANSLS